MDEGEVGFEADPGGVDHQEDQEGGLHFGHLLGEGGEGPEEGRGEPSSTTGPDPLGETKGKRANQGQWHVFENPKRLKVLHNEPIICL